jgi:nicotinate-nucleotide pyrophosphorylase (carboxylating)
MSHATAHEFGPAETAACERLIQLGLEEDLDLLGDVTSAALVPNELQGVARFAARQPGVLAGLDAARMVLFAQVRQCSRCGSPMTERIRRLDQRDAICSNYPQCQTVGLRWQSCSSDGARLQPGQYIARASAPMRVLLACERLALNLMQRLSGVATLTSRYVEAVQGLPCAVLDTRKTTPGWRVLEKYAVRVGGGTNHRMGLFDAVLIKDNHRIAAQQAAAALTLADVVRMVRAAVPAGMMLELEVDSISQLEDAVPGQPDIVLLDNMTLEQLRKAVALRNQRSPRLLLEASGGITLDTVRAVAETGVDRISVGAVTHSAPALDLAVDFETEAQGLADWDP